MKSKPLPRGVSGINNWQSLDVRGPLRSIVAAFFFHEPIPAKKDQADGDAQHPDIRVAQASVMIYLLLHSQPVGSARADSCLHC
jgi:hypothetical protein